MIINKNSKQQLNSLVINIVFWNDNNDEEKQKQKKNKINIAKMDRKEKEKKGHPYK